MNGIKHEVLSGAMSPKVHDQTLQKQPVLLSEALSRDTCPKTILYQNGHFAKMTCCQHRVCQ